MDTERWQILLKAIDHGSLRAAADEMGFTVSGISRSDIRVISIPADSMALEIGSSKTANVIIFAVYIVASGTIPVDRAKEIALAKLAKKPQFMEMNNTAFDRGVELARSHQ